MNPNHGRHDDAPDQDADGAGSESPEEGSAAQRDADDAVSTAGSPTGGIA